MDERIALNMSEAAALIGISKSRMYEIARRDDADFVLKLGKRRLVSRSKLEAWIENHAGKYES